MNPPTTLEDAYGVLLNAARLIAEEGCQHARHDDPHRFATLAAAFDDGKAVPRLQITFLPAGRFEVSHVLTGTKGGQETAVAIFTTTLRVGETQH